MGSSSSKFRRYLQNGDEYAALQVFQGSSELRQNLDPNCSYGDSLKHNSPLHLTAQHAMKPLLRIFLNELNGNPNKRNASSETALHLACQGTLMRGISTQGRRVACVSLILQWQGSEKLDLAAVDDEGNTALHNAAATGLLKCAELLVCHGAPLFIENKYAEKPCDLAEKNGHEKIAEFLEYKMVFSTDFCDTAQDMDYMLSSEVFNGLRAQDLQEAKDQLLVETSDMLHVPLFTAEVLLRNHEWSRQNLLDSWMNDPVECCEEAGISPPTSALQFSMSTNGLKISCERVQEEYQNESLNSPAKTVPLEAETMCDICTTYIPLDEDLIQVPCQHNFCKNCWKEYLTVKIQDGDAHNILCPAFDCQYLVPIDIIENIVSSDMVKRYLQFDIEAFVESNPTIKWCPYPGCGRAVMLPETESVPQEIISISSTPPLVVSHAVDCGNGHYFCWECLGEAHAPCGCEKWKEWHEKIAEVKPQEMRNTCSETEDAANWLWMVSNSKPCPSCKSPIQKNEGCNHMKCTKCKFDYCWVCLEGWKKHSSATGGYFRCNRFDAVQRAEVRTDALINQAEVHNKEMQELKRFLHYYTKYRNHENNYKFEQPFLKTVQEKMLVLAAIIKNSTSKITVDFLEESVYELLRARRILCGSYVYGFYLEDNGYNKTIFEIMQSDLEETTERLAEMVARTYLQTPRTKVVHMTSLVKRKRLDFITAVLKGLIPPETPPSLRKSRRRRYPGLMGIDPVEDEQLSQAILESLTDLDPNDPWIKDQQGKHTNLAAIYDWPDYDSNEEEESSASAVAANLLGVCSKKGCSKPRVRNCRTGGIHEYCSLSCRHADKAGVLETEFTSSEIDPSMDILIALEMSKLQMAEENQTKNCFDESVRDKSPPRTLCKFGQETENEISLSHDTAVDDSPIHLHNETPDSEIIDQFVVSPEPEEEEQKEEGDSDENCDITHVIIPSSQENDESISSDFTCCSSTKTSIAFYLKNSCARDDINSKNVNSSSDTYCKTEKELFAVVQEDTEEDFEAIINSSIG